MGSEMCIRDRVNGVELGGILHSGDTIPKELEAGSVCEIQMPFCARLLPGAYFFNAGVRGVTDGAMSYLHRVIDGLMFRIQAEQSLSVSGVIDFSTDSTPELVLLTQAKGP